MDNSYYICGLIGYPYDTLSANSPMKILIIDDNPAVRTSLKLILSGEFEEIAAVGDPQLIPALINGGGVDVVLLDMNFDTGRLDGSDGLFWLSRIKEGEDAPAVVLITAFGDVPLAVEGMKKGAEDFVTKPWDNDELVAKLHNAVEKNRMTRMQRRSVGKAIEIEQREGARKNMTLEQIKLSHVNDVVMQCGGNLSAAAERLGINRQTLYNILRKK